MKLRRWNYNEWNRKTYSQIIPAISRWRCLQFSVTFLQSNSFFAPWRRFHRKQFRIQIRDERKNLKSTFFCYSILNYILSSARRKLAESGEWEERETWPDFGGFIFSRCESADYAIVIRMLSSAIKIFTMLHEGQLESKDRCFVTLK